MKKILLVSLLLVAALVIFAACNNNGGATDNNVADTPATNGTTNDETASQEPIFTPEPGETITLRYANWNVGTEDENNIERQMIQAFMDAHPGIIIEIDESISGADWTGTLAVAASIGQLPDVFMVNDTGMMAANGWLRDITEIANNDSEFVNLADSIREATQIGNTVFTVPFAQFMMGYFVNRTLFEELNLDPPEFGISIEEFLNLVRQATDLNRPTIGLNYSNQLLEWLPGVRNSNFGFFGYDGISYVLNSPEMLEAISLATELAATGMTYGALSEEQREVFAQPWAGGAFNHGEVGFLWDGSWVIDWLPRYAAEANFELDFIGVPGGRVVITLDILGIASTTEHPEAAYMFARWMGHGVEGYLRRIEIAQANDLNINSLPVSSDARVLAAFEESITLPGLRTALQHMDTAFIDGNKIVPGHVEGRFYAPTGISIPGTDIDNATVNEVIHFSINGHLNFADHADAVNAASRAAMQAVRDTIGN